MPRLAPTLAVAVAGSFLVAGSTAAGASSPSGDAATIAFYRQVQGSYRSVQAISGARHGFLSYTVAAGSVFSYRFGQRSPAGFRAARESVLYLMRNGRVRSFVDTAHAPGLPPLTIVEDATGVWSRIANVRGGCFFRNTGANAIGGVGQPFLGVYGDFAPMRRHGSTVTVRSRYRWQPAGALASEVDTISASTKHLLAYTVHVSGRAAFSFGLSGLREGPTPAFVLAPSPRC